MPTNRISRPRFITAGQCRERSHWCASTCLAYLTFLLTFFSPPGHHLAIAQTLSVSDGLKPGFSNRIFKDPEFLFTWGAYILVGGSGWASYGSQRILGGLAVVSGGPIEILIRGPLNSPGVDPTERVIGSLISDEQGSIIGGAFDDSLGADVPLLTIPYDGGTSMATPLVAGCVAVVRETLVKNGMPNLSAALMRGLLINGAINLSGQYSPSEVGPLPNDSSGWGRVNLAGSIILPGPNPDAGFGEGGPLKQGENGTVIIKVQPHKGKSAKHVVPFAAGPTLKVTLVWTDPPGPELQNDLDLIVTASNGQERHGNMGTSKSFDRVNNVEQIIWHNIPSGDVRFTIHAFRITQFP